MITATRIKTGERMPSSECGDGIVERVVDKIRSRSAVGQNKYGITLEDQIVDVATKIRHAQEEALDLANYLEWMLESLKKENDRSDS